MSRAHSARRRLGIETLESRTLLAGDVHAAVVDGNLIVTGDDQSNIIAVTPGEEQGSFVVSGFSDADGMPTSINGEENGSVELSGVTGNLVTVMREGDDSVGLFGVDVSGNVAVHTGAGADRVFVGHRPLATDLVDEAAIDDPFPSEVPASGPVRIAGNLAIVTGAGDDVVVQAGVHVSGNEFVNTGADNDRLLLGAPIAADAPPNEDPALLPVDVAPSVVVRGNLGVHLGAGDDALATNRLAVGHNMAIHDRAGDAHIALHDTAIAGYAVVATGDGEDSVALEKVRARTAVIHTGAGNDHVRIVDSAFHALGVALGAGDDGLAVSGTNVGWLAYFDGGPGHDTFADLGDNFFQNLIRLRF